MKFKDLINKEDINLEKNDLIRKYLIIFIVGSIIGYIYEVLFYLVVDHNLTNPGYVYGPFLSVYGYGAVLMSLFLNRFKKNPLLVFLLAIFVTGVLEYITGYLMFSIYQRRWWDYTGLFLNIDGYVCLRSVITFAIGGILLIYLIEPFISKKITKNNKYINFLIYLILLIYFIDKIFTFFYRY